MTYPGSKGGSGVWQTIINQLPPHRAYVELFAGSAAIQRRLRPAVLSLGVDLDRETLREVRAETGFHLIELDQMQLRLLSLDDGLATPPCLYQGSALEVVALLPDRSDVLLYADPPYPEAVRSRPRNYYQHEMRTMDAHADLLDRLLELRQTRVAISGYENHLYADRLRDWRRVTYTAPTQGGPREECLWCNYPEPTELHDYRWLGVDYIDRQRIKRKVDGWVRKLSGLAPLERQALLAAMAELR